MRQYLLSTPSGKTEILPNSMEKDVVTAYRYIVFPLLTSVGCLLVLLPITKYSALRSRPEFLILWGWS